MSPEEWKERAIAHLDRIKDYWYEDMTGEVTVELFNRQLRFRHARIAFPGITEVEYKQMLVAFERKGKRGRPEGIVLRKFWIAADDARSLKELWYNLHPHMPRPRWPIHPNQIVAEHYRLNRGQVDVYVNRSARRWPGRLPPIIP